MRGLWMGIVAGLVAVVGCSSNGTAGSSGTSTATTELAGTWSASGVGTSGSSKISATYQVKLVTSTCSVTTPLGVFSVQGPVCFIANNNSSAGSITGSGIPTSSKSLGQGVLVGASADPVPDNSTVNLVFVSASGTKFQEFTGTGTVVGGKMTGSGACSAASTASCTGASATFTGTHQ